MIFRKTLLSIVFSVTSFAAAAAVYDCDIDKKVMNWIPQKVIIAHNSGANTATVNDPIIQHFVGKPISARVKHDNDKRITFAWNITAKDKKGLRFQMIYRATYLKSSGKLSMTAKPAGYSNNFSSNGTCKLS